jgi:uncharacterized protein (UPF0332 family)
VNWPEYIVLAEELSGLDSEGSRRSAVSRAYYGAFNSARRWLEANVGPISNRAAHRQVWAAFNAPGSASEATRAKWEDIGEIGERLRILRNQADYDDGMPNLDLRAPEAVIRAERILALLAELDQEIEGHQSTRS